MALKINNFSFSKELIQFAIEWWYLRLGSVRKTRDIANESYSAIIYQGQY